MILPDWMIRMSGAITPYSPAVKRAGVISYGESSYGYDLRAGYQWKVFTNVWGAVVDPKRFNPKSFVDVELDSSAKEAFVVIPPNSFALCQSMEWLKIPRNCLTLVIGKSTYARCGIVLNCTPLEPEWEGHVTLEVSNTTPLPACVYAGEGIGQVLFFRAEHTCQSSYADKNGKYQGQTEVTLPRVD